MAVTRRAGLGMKTEERIYSASGETSNGTVSETHLRLCRGEPGKPCRQV